MKTRDEILNEAVRIINKLSGTSRNSEDYRLMKARLDALCWAGELDYEETYKAYDEWASVNVAGFASRAKSGGLWI